MATASAHSTMSVANSPVVSAVADSTDTIMPRPLPPMTNSPTTAPVMDRVKPLRMPVRIAARAIGASMWTIIAGPEAPSSSAASVISSSMVRRPSTVDRTSGKRTSRVHSRTIGVSP